MYSLTFQFRNFQYHALIDTGALITGMSNEAVARALLEEGLTHVDGVVYMDSSKDLNLRLFCTTTKRPLTNSTKKLVTDAKMVLERHGSGYRVTPLASCGLPPERRFTFYDQVRFLESNHLFIKIKIIKYNSFNQNNQIQFIQSK